MKKYHSYISQLYDNGTWLPPLLFRLTALWDLFSAVSHSDLFSLPFIFFSTWSFNPVNPSYSPLSLLSWIKSQLYCHVLFQPSDFCVSSFHSSFLLVNLTFFLSILFGSVYPMGTFCTLQSVSFHLYLLLHHPSLSVSHRAQFLFCPAWGSRGVHRQREVIMFLMLSCILMLL